MDREIAEDLWSRLAEEGKAPIDPRLAKLALASYTVGIEPWLERLSKTYLRNLCRRGSHTKLLLGEYGGGKTHFLMAVANRAHLEGYAFAYIECASGLSLSSPYDLYREVVRKLWLPGEAKPGLQALLHRVVNQKQEQMIAAEVPNVDAAFRTWLDELANDEHPESSFGRVISEALRSIYDPENPGTGDAARRWLNGEEAFTQSELMALRLTKIPEQRKAEFGRNMFLSLLRFVREAQLHGTVLLFDEVETLFSAKGKALSRLLGALRVFVDLPTSVAGGVPLLALFAAVPQIKDSLTRYPALDQRLVVLGATFHEGNDRAPRIDLSQLGADEQLLRDLGVKLAALGEVALDYSFNMEVQETNIGTLVRVATKRNMDIDRRRLFIKTWTSLLDHQVNHGERVMLEEEVLHRYSGSFDALSALDQDFVGEEA